SSATLTIAANDAAPGTLAFSSSSYSVAENGITATITVSRSGGSDGAVAVNYASANGTAIAGSDYTSASGTLNWANADSADKTFTVSITDDALYELDETLNLSISGATNGAALGTSSATLTIAANDAAPGTLAFSSSSYSVAENGTTATITVSRSGGSDGAVAVNYASANGTATAGADYASASGTLNWANADSASKTFTVSITDDAIYEGNETISLSLNTETGGSTLGTSTANLTIVENESSPSGGSLTFSTTSYTTSEANSTLSLIVRRIGGSAGAVSVDYITSNITAAAGSDYSGASSVLNWADGDSTDKSINITISNDSVYEPTESFKVTLSNVSSGASIGNSIATINITDDDAVPGTLSLSSSTYSVQENNSVATLTVNRSGGSNGAVSVNYASANGTAVAGSDYSPATGSLTWADGDSASKSFIVVITNDTAYEADETLTLNLSGATNGAALGTSSAVLTILGNDAAPGTLAFTSSTYSVSENGINATISVSRTAGSDGAVSVDFNSTDITAISGDDYQSLSGSLNWNNGDSAEKTFIININDNVVADGDKTVSLNLTNVSGGASLGTSGSTLTIVDNENSNQAPAAPNLVSPGNGATGVDAFNMSFTWDTVTDPDGDAVNYQLYYCEDANFAGCTVTPINTSLSSASMMFGISGGMGLALVGMVSTASRRQRMTSMLMVVLMAIAFSGCGAPSGPPASPVFSQISYYAGDIQPGKTYYWKVVAVDGNGGQSSSQVWSFTTN
ncbi:MAG: hypothetical protein OEY11_03540, partial [Gammaproteobacteria bacterium]|nr:hypothetical protein [Gammaproteobacteria bacterium]